MSDNVKLYSDNFKFYDPERKNKFLYEQYPNEATRTTYGSLLSKISVYEEDYKKDLCDFSPSEATELMFGLRKTTKNARTTAYSIINKYVEWCMLESQNYSKTGFNSFKFLDMDDDKFVHKLAQEMSYYTRDEMYQICDMLFNYIDKAIICLLFEGVKGRPKQEHSFEELKNLKKTDLIPEVNKIILTRYDENNKPMTHSIEVDKRTMDILVVAAREETYHRINGNDKSKFAIQNLSGSPYLIQFCDRPNEGSGDEDGRFKRASFNSRFSSIRKNVKEANEISANKINVEFLTPTNLFLSGLFEKCEKLEQEYGILTVKHFNKIFKDLKLNENQGIPLKGKYETYKKYKASKQ